MTRNLRTCALIASLGVAPAAAIVGPPGPVVAFVAAADVEPIELASEPESYTLPSRDSFTELDALGGCSGTRLRGIDVHVRWEVRRDRVEAYRVDITKFPRGFQSGRFVTSDLRPPTESGLVFQSAEPGIFYAWRLLTKTDAGWIVSGNGRFDAPTCAVDMKDE